MNNLIFEWENGLCTCGGRPIDLSIVGDLVIWSYSIMAHSSRDVSGVKPRQYYGQIIEQNEHPSPHWVVKKISKQEFQFHLHS